MSCKGVPPPPPPVDDDIEEDGLDSPAVRAKAEREDALVEAKRVRRWRPTAKGRARLVWWRELFAVDGADLLL